ncbi:MAG: endonuclease III [Candidatus Micrarchaeota archaeon]|nr:endonuclease III [Candidatus Micrarchaeota archaeon]
MKKDVFQEIVKRLEKANKDAPVYKAQDYLDSKEKKFVFVFLSSRTKDEVTLEATRRLFQKYHSLEEIRKVPEEELAELIKPVAFYKQKAKNLKKIHHIPENLEELLKLPGVGIKIAKVYLASLGQPYVGVDTHVHRILNRIGIVNTRTPEETDKILEEMIPPSLKPKINLLLVAHGQKTCLPRNPKCEQCPLQEICKKKI